MFFNWHFARVLIKLYWKEIGRSSPSITLLFGFEIYSKVFFLLKLNFRLGSVFCLCFLLIFGILFGLNVSNFVHHLLPSSYDGNLSGKKHLIFHSTNISFQLLPLHLIYLSYRKRCLCKSNFNFDLNRMYAALFAEF